VVGLAFQIRDDLLDIEGRPDETGKALAGAAAPEPAVRLRMAYRRA